MKKIRIAVFASGTGTNFQTISNNIDKGEITAEIGVVISNNKDSGALKFASEKGFRTEHISKKQFSGFDEMSGRILEILEKESIDLIVLAGYMKLLHSKIVKHFENRIMNIHPALLPSFGGKGFYGERVHKAVLETGAKVTGVTVHFVNEVYDQGPIILQECVPVMDDDDHHSLASRVLKVEHSLFSKAIHLFQRGFLSVDGRKVSIKKVD